MRLLLALLPTFLSAQLAIEHVTVIDPRTRTVLPDTTVLIDSSIIRQVGPAQATPVPHGYRRVDGRNRYLIPGLWDSHVHLTKAGANSLALFIANGVTSVRDMGSDPEEVLRWRKEIEAGRIGPRIKTSGRILEAKTEVARMLTERTVEPVARLRQPVANAGEARRAVAELQRLGVDHLKVRSVPDQATFEALAAEAGRVGLPLAGHALAKPQELLGRLRSVEHVLTDLPVAGPERRQLFRAMRDAGTSMSSTTVNFEGSILVPYQRAKALLDDRRGRLDPRRRYVGKYLLADWREQVEERRHAKEYLDIARKRLPAIYRDLREMHEEGVRLLAGTDVAVALIYPGFHLHEELELLVRHVGLPPMEVLRIATHNPAEFYRHEGRFGGIAAGQAGDLVLLERNPLEDIRHTRTILAVIARGRLLDRAALDRLLVQAAAEAK